MELYFYCTTTLIVTKEQIDEGLAIISEAIKIADEHMPKFTLMLKTYRIMKLVARYHEIFKFMTQNYIQGLHNEPKHTMILLSSTKTSLLFHITNEHGEPGTMQPYGSA